MMCTKLIYLFLITFCVVAISRYAELLEYCILIFYSNVVYMYIMACYVVLCCCMNTKITQFFFLLFLCCCNDVFIQYQACVEFYVYRLVVNNCNNMISERGEL